MSEVYRSGEGTRMEEMHERKNQLNIPVDPTTVGDTQNKLIDESGNENHSKKKSNEKPTIAALSVDEMQKWIDTWKKELWEFAQIDPDALSTKDKWPEAIKQAWFEVREKGWPC